MAPTMTTAATMLRSTKPVRVSHQKVLQFIVSQKNMRFLLQKYNFFCVCAKFGVILQRFTEHDVSLFLPIVINKCINIIGVMKKIMLIALVAVCAMGCCKKSAKSEGQCCKEGEKTECCQKAEEQCCQNAADTTAEVVEEAPVEAAE